MSYAERGIAIPRSVTARRGVTARGWGHGVGGYVGALGAASVSVESQPTSGGGGASSTAAAAVIAVTSATASQLRSPIAAVRAFQQENGGLTVDGLYGSRTRTALATATGRTNLPAVPSSGGGSSTVTSLLTGSTPGTPSSIAPDGGSSTTTSSWLVPVAVVSTLVIASGIILMRRRPVSANGRRRRRR